MKKIPTKADVRKALQAEVQAFIASGGCVNQVPAGKSGKDATQPEHRTLREIFTGPKQERTPLDHVVAELQSRRKSVSSAKPKVKKRPKKKVIYDDFGEPLRTVWVEE
ncbi:hypothetical protein [Aequoribacter sp.]|uniref:hypothetical protein n=1 Tax=Aequoribacter sp. TaxID=2847771 RepID=UPI003F69950D